MNPKVKRGYRLVYTGRENRSLRKENTDLKKEVFIDVEDDNEILYMMGVNINNPHVKIYLQYHDGSERRLKLGCLRHRYLRKIVNKMKEYRKYPGLYQYKKEMDRLMKLCRENKISIEEYDKRAEDAKKLSPAFWKGES